MAATAAVNQSWLKSELTRLFGFDAGDELAILLLDMEPSGVREYMHELLGQSQGVDAVVDELLRRRGAPPALTPAPAPAAAAPAPAPSGGGGRHNRLSQKERARQRRQGQEVQGPGVTMFGQRRGNGPTLGGIRVSYTPTQAPAPPTAEEVQAAAEQHELEQLQAALLPSGRAPSGGLVVNCLHCGCLNIVQKDLSRKPTSADDLAGLGQCTACGGSLDRRPDLANSLGFQTALELKNRLVRYDKETAARTHVVDDQADYYASSAWLDDLEREELERRDAERHEKLHSRNRNVTVTFDLAGRKIVQVPDGEEDKLDFVFGGSGSGSAAAEANQRLAAIEALKVELGTGGGCSSRGQQPRNAGGAGGAGAYSNDTLQGRGREVYLALQANLAPKQQAASSTMVSDMTSVLAPWRQQRPSGPVQHLEDEEVANLLEVGPTGTGDERAGLEGDAALAAAWSNGATGGAAALPPPCDESQPDLDRSCNNTVNRRPKGQKKSSGGDGGGGGGTGRRGTQNKSNSSSGTGGGSGSEGGEGGASGQNRSNNRSRQRRPRPKQGRSATKQRQGMPPN